MVSFCREHLDEATFRKRFRHAYKQQVAGAIWYIAGRISMAHLMHHANANGFFKDEQASADRVVDHVARMAGWSSPRETAEAVSFALQPSEDTELRQISENNVVVTEALRRQCLYVDDADGKIISDPALVQREESVLRLREAKNALAVSAFLMSDKLDFRAYLGMLPRSQRLRLENDASLMISGIEAMRVADSQPVGS